MSKKILLTFIFIFASIFFVGCEKLKIIDGNPIITTGDYPNAINITSVDNNFKVYVGDSIQLLARVFPETVDQTVTWHSTNESIALVDENGVVTGVNDGKVTITATSTKRLLSGDYVFGTFYLTVIEKNVPFTQIEIIGSNELFVDELIKLEFVRTPANANTSVTWSSSDINVATVDFNGRVLGISAGTATITITANNNIFYDFSITVLERSGIPLEMAIKARNIVEIDELVKLHLLVSPLGSINTVNWSSMDEQIASVNNQGIVTGIGVGFVELIATSTESPEITASFIIEVIDTRINETNLQQNVVDVIAQTKNSILGVSNYTTDKDTKVVSRSSIGSGFVYKAWFILKDGSIIYDIYDVPSYDDVEKYCYFLITNRHVVEHSSSVKIYLHNEDIEIDAMLMQYDSKVDLAIIYFEYTDYIKPLKLANSDELLSGHFAIAIGNPSGYKYSSSATFGIISHPKRYISDDTTGDSINDWDAEYIQHDVAINPGNSGGPLLNLKGEVIGVNTLKFAATNIDNMGFSIPINVVKDLIGILEDSNKPIRAFMGVTIIEIRSLIAYPDDKYPVPQNINYGVYVIGIVENGVADKSGILVNDIILSFNDVDITNTISLRAQLGKIVVGSNQEIEVEVYRNGEIIRLTLVF